MKLIQTHINHIPYSDALEINAKFILTREDAMNHPTPGDAVLAFLSRFDGFILVNDARTAIQKLAEDMPPSQERDVLEKLIARMTNFEERGI